MWIRKTPIWGPLQSNLDRLTCGDVKYVVFLCQRDCECLSLHDAVETELFPLVAGLNPDHVAQLLDDVLHDRRGLGVDDALGAAGQPADEDNRCKG